MRSLPKPNTNDDVSNRLAHGTTQNHNAKEVAVSDGLKFKERQILAVQDGLNKAAFGFYGTANKFGLKVAGAGVDVLTATDGQLIFNSEQNIFKIALTGNLTLTKAAAAITATTSINHNLSSIPACIAFFTNASGYYQLMPYTSALLSSGTVADIGKVTFTLTAYTDSTKLYLSVDLPNYASNPEIALATTYSIKYYLLQETAN